MKKYQRQEIKEEVRLCIGRCGDLKACCMEIGKAVCLATSQVLDIYEGRYSPSYKERLEDKVELKRDSIGQVIK